MRYSRPEIGINSLAAGLWVAGFGYVTKFVEVTIALDDWCDVIRLDARRKPSIGKARSRLTKNAIEGGTNLLEQMDLRKLYCGNQNQYQKRT